MALSKTVTTPQGFEAVDAYHRAEQPAIGADKASMSFLVRSYKDENAPFFFEKTIDCQYDIAGENPISQAYAHLKTLPEFADAADC